MTKKNKESKKTPKSIDLGELTGKSIDNSAPASSIKEFLTKMKTQDNRSTAFPYYYVIRTKVEESAPIDACEVVKYYWNDDTYDSMDEILEYCKEAEYTEREIETAKREVCEVGVRYRWDTRRMFLTETDAENHLRMNRHHYSSDAHTYVEHAWRAPELETFFNDLFNYFGINK